MHLIALRFKGDSDFIDGRHVTARGLHGLLYHVLKEADPVKATWLHGHAPPKPYTLAPYYHAQNGSLAGIRLTAVNDETAALFLQAWRAVERATSLHLGQQRFRVEHVEAIPASDFAQLAMVEPARIVQLEFLSPTSFRQGPGDLPLPLPVNVFRQSFAVWQAFAPSHLGLPGDWLDWCEANVFVVEHQIQTASAVISKREPPFLGFVGRVQFVAKSDAALYLSVWQGLARLAPFSGIGRKTTMGMGAVELIKSGETS